MTRRVIGGKDAPLDVKLKSFLYLFLKKLQNPLTNKKSFAIILKHVDGRLAQLGEHLPYKQRVIGSSPILSTKKVLPSFREMAW